MSTKITQNGHPAGTMIRVAERVQGGRWGHRDVPIEEITEGMAVLSWRDAKSATRILRTGSPVVRVTKSHYTGGLVTAIAKSGATVSYTGGQPCAVRLATSFPKQDVVYLARRRGSYRVGRGVWNPNSDLDGQDDFRYNPRNTTIDFFRLTLITRHRADDVWLLSAHGRNEATAAVVEVAERFGLPTEFPPTGDTQDRTTDGSPSQPDPSVVKCLTAFDRDVEHPLWSRGTAMFTLYAPVTINASNLMDTMTVCEVDQAAPSPDGTLGTALWRGGWRPVTVTRTPYDGPVYSIELDKDLAYVANGIVVPGH